MPRTHRKEKAMLDSGKSKHPKGPESFGFDLEERLCDKAYAKKLDKHINDQVELIKDFQRKGGSKEEYQRLAHVLNGYIGLQKVSKRCEVQSMMKRKSK